MSWLDIAPDIRNVILLQLSPREVVALASTYRAGAKEIFDLIVPTLQHLDIALLDRAPSSVLSILFTRLQTKILDFDAIVRTNSARILQLAAVEVKLLPFERILPSIVRYDAAELLRHLMLLFDKSYKDVSFWVNGYNTPACFRMLLDYIVEDTKTPLEGRWNWTSVFRSKRLRECLLQKLDSFSLIEVKRLQELAGDHPEIFTKLYEACELREILEASKLDPLAERVAEILEHGCSLVPATIVDYSEPLLSLSDYEDSDEDYDSDEDKGSDEDYDSDEDYGSDEDNDSSD